MWNHVAAILSPSASGLMRCGTSHQIQGYARRPPLFVCVVSCTRVVARQRACRLNLFICLRVIANMNAKSSEVQGSKLTHLYSHDKYMKTIGSLTKYANLTVLYLHNNEIERIQNLQDLRHLTALYLQRNRIRKLENLERLSALRRLYVGHNRISVVENLEGLERLDELHVEKQDLDGSDALCFDPRTVMSLAKSLQVLNVARNNITTLDNLSPLKYLKIINAGHNRITRIEGIVDVIRCWYHLQEATFSGNPAAKTLRYREAVVGSTTRLCTLDGKQVSDTTRRFIKRLESEKTNNANRNLTILPEEMTNLTRNYPLAVQKAISSSVLHPTDSIQNARVLSTSMSAAASDNYIPWNQLPNSFTSTHQKIPPQLRKHKKRNKPKPPMATNLPSFL